MILMPGSSLKENRTVQLNCTSQHARAIKDLVEEHINDLMIRASSASKASDDIKRSIKNELNEWETLRVWIVNDMFDSGF